MYWIQDAGHGGKDPGAVANGNIEKNYTLEAALYVNKRLNELGINSTCTRMGDVDLEENNRVNMVKNYKKCISHHFNAGGGSGVECIVSKNSNQQLAKQIINQFKENQLPIRPKSVYTRQLVNGQDYYYMHRRTGNCDVIIVEYDFVDGPQSDKIKDKIYREKMYELVVKAICIDEKVPYSLPIKKPVEVIVKPDENQPSSWAKEAWEEATAKGILDGTNPKNTLTREQIALILQRLGLLN